MAWLADEKRFVKREERAEIIETYEKYIEKVKSDYNITKLEQLVDIDPEKAIEMSQVAKEVRRLKRVHRSEVDLAYFTWEYFSEAGNPDNKAGNLDGFDLKSPDEFADFHLEICDIMNHVSLVEKNAKICVAAPRGHAKSTYLSKSFPCREVVFRNRKYIIAISETPNVSTKNLDWLKTQLKYNEKLRNDFGPLLHPKEQKNKQDNSTSFIAREDTGDTPNLLTLVEAYSTGQAIRGANWNGHRPDLIICDDLEDEDSNAGTPEQREKLKNWFAGKVEYLGDPSGKKTAMVYMGTTVHPECLLMDILYKRPDFKTKIYRALINPPERQDLWAECESIYKDQELTIELPEYPVDSIGIAENSILEWVEVERPLETSVVFESSLDQTNWTTVENGGQLIPAGTDLSGKSLYLRYTLSTSDTGQTPILEPTLIWYIQQQGYKIRPATSAIRVTPDNVSRWQLEQKSYATGWHTTGTREGESLKIHVQDLIDPSDGETDGAVDLYVYEDGKSSVRYLLDTDGTYRTQIFRNENIYEFWYDGQKLAETEAPEIGWHHLGLTWDATTFWLYLDGSLVESVSVESVDLIGTVYLYIGCDKEGNNQWSSLIDDLVVSNEFKDASYFAARANSTDPSGPSLTANVYPFDNTLSAIGDSNIVYQGTAEAYPVFTITFAASVDNFRITDGDEYIQVIHNFQPNDVLVVDCENQVVRLNGASIMESIDLDSDFFSVENGDVIGIDPAGVATVDVAFTERWL